MISKGAAGRLHVRAGVVLFADLVRAFGGGPVADVGCGPGHTTALLRELGADAFGIDLSPVMIEIACREHPDARFKVGSMTRRWRLPTWRIAESSDTQHGNFILHDLRISGHQRQSLTSSLSDENSIERISVDLRQPPGGERMCRGNGKFSQIAFKDCFWQVFRPELTHCLFDRNFPDARRAHKDIDFAVDHILYVSG